MMWLAVVHVVVAANVVAPADDAAVGVADVVAQVVLGGPDGCHRRRRRPIRV